MKNLESFDPTDYQQELIGLIKALDVTLLDKKKYFKTLKYYTKENGDVFSKDEIIKAYRLFAGRHGLAPFSQDFIRKIQMKPTRTISGVTPVTVLTKPFPCPGKCIFCPNDVRMPKSYLSDEPGAQRAERNHFDPYLQTYNRLQALHNIGHAVAKAEIIILGGTWSFYSEPYQIWFIKECFRALNDFGAKRDDRSNVKNRYRTMLKTYQEREEYGATSEPAQNQAALEQHQIQGDDLQKTYNQTVSELYVAPEKKAGFDKYQQADWEVLEKEQQENESAAVRCVGLVVETRPDNISPAEVRRIRRLGCTKTQIGLQSLQDEVLDKNNRGHKVAASRRAIRLLRQAGFKIHAHWMANLYGSSVEKDKADYDLLFSDPDFKPDELKVYPCSLIGSAELMQYYEAGLWQPYSKQELLAVIRHAISTAPPYCRLTRIIRDIPSTDIVSGNKLTNFRQIAEQDLAKDGLSSRDIRAREIRNEDLDPDAITYDEVMYETSVSQEIFMQYLMKDKLLGFLRLSLPKDDLLEKPIFAELKNSAIIREVHVYGPSQVFGKSQADKPQHLGLGTKLIEKAKLKAKQADYTSVAVISAVGTREYYRKRGFEDGQLYQHYSLA